MAQEKFVLGLDYGTDTVRALVIDAATGKELGSQVAAYRRWARASTATPRRTSSASTLWTTSKGSRWRSGAPSKQPPGTGAQGRRHRHRHHRLDALRGRRGRALPSR